MVRRGRVGVTLEILPATEFKTVIVGFETASEMEIEGMGVEYYEDVALEVMRDHGPGRVVTAEEIKRFAAEFDPMPFHLDEEAAKASVLGGLCASSVHVLALGSQLAHEGQGDADEMAVISALGWDAVRLRSPLFAGDHIRARSCVESKRESVSRPGCGIVTLRNEILRADGGLVASYNVSVLVEKRPAGGGGKP